VGEQTIVTYLNQIPQELAFNLTSYEHTETLLETCL